MKRRTSQLRSRKGSARTAGLHMCLNRGTYVHISGVGGAGSVRTMKVSTCLKKAALLTLLICTLVPRLRCVGRLAVQVLLLGLLR